MVPSNYSGALDERRRVWGGGEGLEGDPQGGDGAGSCWGLHGNGLRDCRRPLGAGREGGRWRRAAGEEISGHTETTGAKQPSKCIRGGAHCHYG